MPIVCSDISMHAQAWEWRAYASVQVLDLIRKERELGVLTLSIEAKTQAVPEF